MKTLRWLPFFALVVLGLLMPSCACFNSPAANQSGVRISRTNDLLRVELNGKLFTEYYYTNVPRPFCYPLLGPGGVAMTRNYPMADVPNEQQDHPHHRSLWFAFGDVNGHDLWSESKTSGRIVHRGFEQVTSGNQSGLIQTTNDWVSAEGKALCTDEQTIRFYAPENGQIQLDFAITLYATHGEVTFGDSKEGMFAVRVAETMRVLKPATKGEQVRAGEGHIVLSTGVSDDGASASAAKAAKREAVTWGKRAAWCDYYGPVDGKIFGIAIFDHPANPRHPTWWHVRDYGLFAANPFGQHDFERLPDHHAGDLKIPAGQSITFRYRVVLHEGDEKNARIAERYADYVKAADTKIK